MARPGRGGGGGRARDKERSVRKQNVRTECNWGKKLEDRKEINAIDVKVIQSKNYFYNYVLFLIIVWNVILLTTWIPTTIETITENCEVLTGSDLK